MSQSPFAASYASYPARLGVVRWSARRLTLVAKITFDVSDDGSLRPVPWPDQEPIGLDRLAPGGELAWPSDFAPYKPSCDVIVAGDDARYRGGAGTIEVGELVRVVAHGESLAPREVFAPDPTAPEVFDAWTSGAVAPTRFQCAPPDRRTSLLAPPFAIAASRDGVALRARFAGPWPSVTLVDRAGRHLGRPSLPIDLVGLALAQRKVTLVGRAVIDATDVPLEETVLVVQLDEQGGPASGWLAPTFITPRDVVVPPATRAVASAAASLGASIGVAAGGASVLPPVASPSPEPSVEGTAIARADVDPSPARLPFRASSSTVPASRADGPAVSTAPWGDTGTRVATPDVVRAMPFRSAQAKVARRDLPLGAPLLGIEELVARVAALDDDPAPDVRATLSVDLERWAERLDDPSPTGALAALLHHG